MGHDMPIIGNIISESDDGLLNVEYVIASPEDGEVKTSVLLSHKISQSYLRPPDDGNFPDERFLILPCVTGSNKSSSFIRVKHTNDTRLGWIIPANYYSEPEIHNEGNSFLADFAFAGLRFAVTNTEILQFSNIQTLIGPFSNTIDFEEIYPEEISFCVIDKQKFEENFTDLSNFKLALMRSGVFTVESVAEIDNYKSFLKDSNYMDRFRDIFHDHETKNIKINDICEAVRDEAKNILSIINPFKLNFKSAWAYLSYYQSFELIIEHVLSKKVEDIAEEQLKAWKLKEKLMDITGEYKRLSLMDGYTKKHNNQIRVFTELKEICKRILVKCDEEFEKDREWVAYMYKCRNLLVHNQLSLYRKNIYEELEDLNVAMFKVVMEVIFNYEYKKAS